MNHLQSHLSARDELGWVVNQKAVTNSVRVFVMPKYIMARKGDLIHKL